MKYKFLSLFLFSLIPLIFYCQSNDKLIDSINELRKFSNDASKLPKDRLLYSKKVSLIALETKNDSIILRANRDLVYNYLINDDFESFRELSLKNLKLAKELNDSLAIAFTSKNLGWYYYTIEEDNTESYSYLTIALEYFDIKKILKEKAEVLYSIAIIQDLEKDYLGSEQNAIEALKLLDNLDYVGIDNNKYNLLNLLGSLSYKLEDYEKSIEYHFDALKFTKKNSYDDKYIETQNSLALIYRSKKEYDKALGIYEKLVKNNELKENDIIFYALIFDNYTYTKFLADRYDYDDLERDFKKVLVIADSIGDSYLKLAASIDLAKFYKANEEKDSSFVYARDSYEISKEISVNELYLESMLLLADLTEGKTSKGYLEEHIKLDDSLIKKERNARNKFARTKYETDKLEEENQQISKENLYLTILSAGLLLTALLLYIVISQRAKNKQLRLVQAQQEANEEIYNLMLNQQDKVEEARAQEKTRVSKELHDGVLGRLFGARLSLDSLNFVEGKEAIKNRAGYISQLKTIEEDIRKISHEMNTDFVSGSGFMDIVSELIENQTQAYGLTYDFDYTEAISWDTVANKTKINIYRIVQESMQNIYKHAEAKHINISFSLKNDVICLNIIDDGKGFDTSKGRKGIGLKNMTSRVAEVNGKIEFTSQINKGTEVEVKIPYIT